MKRAHTRRWSGSRTRTSTRETHTRPSSCTARSFVSRPDPTHHVFAAACLFYLGRHDDAAAEAEARALMARIRAAGRLDFDRDVPDPRFGVETMYEPGGGKMLGVLLAERAETSPGSTRHSTLDATREASTHLASTRHRTRQRKSWSSRRSPGRMRGEWRVPGWAPPRVRADA